MLSLTIHPNCVEPGLVRRHASELQHDGSGWRLHSCVRVGDLQFTAAAQYSPMIRVHLVPCTASWQQASCRYLARPRVRGIGVLGVHVRQHRSFSSSTWLSSRQGVVYPCLSGSRGGSELIPALARFLSAPPLKTCRLAASDFIVLLRK